MSSFALLASLGCGGGRAPEAAVRPDLPDDVVRMTGVVLDRFEDDRLTARAKIDTLTLDRRTGLAQGHEVVIDVLDAEGSSSAAAQLRAPAARSDLKKRAVTLTGGVELEDRDGRVLRTQILTYDAAKDWVESEGAVQLQGANFQAEGARLTGHPGARTLHVEGPLRTRIEPSP